MPSRALRAFQLGSTVARALPRPVANAVGRVAAAAVALPFAGGRRAQVERNLRRVHGPDFGGLALQPAVVATFESYARYYVDSFRLPGTPAGRDRGGHHRRRLGQGRRRPRQPRRHRRHPRPAPPRRLGVGRASGSPPAGGGR